jgi:hypothetical protein
MARPLVFTANGREPPGRHLSSTRFQNAFSTGVEAALASLPGFTSGQPDGGRSHCGTPGSRATALVPEGACAAEFTRNSFANPEGIALSPKTHGLSEDLAAVASPKAAVHATEVGGVCCSEETSTGETSFSAQTRSSRSLRYGQPLIDRTGQVRMSIAETIVNTTAQVRALQLRCAVTPWS